MPRKFFFWLVGGRIDKNGLVDRSFYFYLLKNGECEVKYRVVTCRSRNATETVSQTFFSSGGRWV